MEDLTFGEQVKIILGRKGMTIKELAETIETRTGKKMSRQNLTQRLGRDNFQEQDMRMIAAILGCPFQLSIMGGETVTASARTAAQHEETSGAAADMPIREKTAGMDKDERDMTIGELYDIHEELSELEANAKAGEPVEAIREELEKPKKERFGEFFLKRKNNETAKEETGEKKENNASHEVRLSDSADTNPPVKMQDTKKDDFEPVISHDDAEEDRELGEVNPYTGREYQSNSVRMHPTRIGYVQVYDRSIHKWTDMTEWAFLGYQERKKALLGKAYEPPIYLD